MTVYQGRPADCRGETEEKVYDFLEEAGVSFSRMDHAPVLTMEDCLAIDEAAGFEICKNLFLTNRQETEFYLLLMPGGKPFRTSEFSRAACRSSYAFIAFAPFVRRGFSCAFATDSASLPLEPITNSS